MERDQFFSHIFDENSDRAAAAREQKQLSFEARVIKRLFAECGIKISSWGKLVNSCRDVTGQPILNFRWFNSSFRFPAVLCGRRLYTGRRGPALHELTVVDLLRPPAKNRAIKLVMYALEEQNVADDVHFVFALPLARKMYCVHNLPHVDGRPGTRLTFQMPQNVVHIELTESLFSAVGRDWWEYA